MNNVKEIPRASNLPTNIKKIIADEQIENIAQNGAKAITQHYEEIYPLLDFGCTLAFVPVLQNTAEKAEQVDDKINKQSQHDQDQQFTFACRLSFMLIPSRITEGELAYLTKQCIKAINLITGMTLKYPVGDNLEDEMFNVINRITSPENCSLADTVFIDCMLRKAIEYGDTNIENLNSNEKEFLTLLTKTHEYLQAIRITDNGQYFDFIEFRKLHNAISANITAELKYQPDTKNYKAAIKDRKESCVAKPYDANNIQSYINDFTKMVNNPIWRDESEREELVARIKELYDTLGQIERVVFSCITKTLHRSWSKLLQDNDKQNLDMQAHEQCVFLDKLVHSVKTSEIAPDVTTHYVIIPREKQTSFSRYDYATEENIRKYYSLLLKSQSLICYDYHISGNSGFFYIKQLPKKDVILTEEENKILQNNLLKALIKFANFNTLRTESKEQEQIAKQIARSVQQKELQQTREFQEAFLAHFADVEVSDEHSISFQYYLGILREAHNILFNERREQELKEPMQNATLSEESSGDTHCSSVDESAPSTFLSVAEREQYEESHRQNTFHRVKTCYGNLGGMA